MSDRGRKLLIGAAVVAALLWSGALARLPEPDPAPEPAPKVEPVAPAPQPKPLPKPKPGPC